MRRQVEIAKPGMGGGKGMLATRMQTDSDRMSKSHDPETKGGATARSKARSAL